MRPFTWAVCRSSAANRPLSATPRTRGQPAPRCLAYLVRAGLAGIRTNEHENRPSAGGTRTGAKATDEATQAAVEDRCRQAHAYLQGPDGEPSPLPLLLVSLDPLQMSFVIDRPGALLAVASRPAVGAPSGPPGP
ncbi:hypothetical protein Hesp01_74380 [Herbidospora sp. NBRC 101105]|nr:hypothetical protein Hesp01_74380 [Herbidospora sp. NBRC 101105]